MFPSFKPQKWENLLAGASLVGWDSHWAQKNSLINFWKWKKGSPEISGKIPVNPSQIECNAHQKSC